MKCDFGCGNIAHYKLKSGKMCCSESCNSCPEMRRKNSLSLTGRIWSKGLHFNHGRPPVNKGKTYEQSYGKLYANELKKKIGYAKTGSTGLASTPELEIKRRAKIKKTMSNTSGCKYGGYRFGSGRGKKGWYKGYWCDSSWELAYVIYQLENNITIERNWEKFPYDYKGQQHNWTPDFKENGIYIEIKGYETEQVKAKFKSFLNELKVLKKEEMKPILKYVTSKYGKDFIKLYDKR